MANARISTGACETPILAGHDYPHMVSDWYVARVREMRRQRQARLNEIRTPRQARGYQARVREAIERAFSPTPPRTPLNPRVTGVVETRAFRIEKILFESRPGFLVSSNLYIPSGCDARHPLPGVLADCGHSGDGKQALVYQGFCQRLAVNGFVTLVIEPCNQGERDQYVLLPKHLRKGLSDACCNAHNMMGKQLELIGEYYGMWRAWDGIRALDYLLTRPEVDPRHVGVTGNSGGGTMSTWYWGVERRLTMAAPSCFVTTFAANLENEMPADAEQYPPGVVGAGLELADFMIARAPEPALLLGQHFDFFDRRGLREAHREVKRFYEILGAPGNHDLFIGPTTHGYSRHNQEAMVAFFRKHVGKPNGIKRLTDEQIVDMGSKLLVTPKNDVVAAGSTPIYELIAATARKQAAQRRKLSVGALSAKIRRVLNIEAVAGTAAGSRTPPHFRILKANTYAQYRSARYAVETELPAERDNPNAIIRAVLHKPMPTGGQTLDVEKEVTLYLPHISAEAELSDPKLAKKLIGKRALYALDVRGLGESLSVGLQAEDFFGPYKWDYMHHGYGILFSQSFLGRRVFDVLRTIDLLVSEGARSIDLVARGQGALLAAFAGVLCPKTIRSVTLRHAPVSFLEWATAPVVKWPAANFPRGVLTQFDLPDVYRALGNRLRMSDPWDALMQRSLSPCGRGPT